MTKTKFKLSPQQQAELQSLLEDLRKLAEQLGRTPFKRECPFSTKLKCFIGPWSYVCDAAGLARAGSPEQVALRMRQRQSAREDTIAS